MKKYLFLFFIALSIGSCTDLEEELREDTSVTDTPDPNALLQSVYSAMILPYQDQSRLWAAQEHTGDAVIGPTRGGDWDDNGIWRSLHNHSWDADHDFLRGTFSELLQIVFATTNLLQFEPTAEVAAQSRLIRAFAVYAVLDGWGQVPYREEGSSLLEDAIVLSSEEAVDLILSEMDAIMADLPVTPVNRANRDAAKVLKMKTLLNKGMYLNRATPSFDAGDMSAVIALADEIINSGSYSLATNYYDNFAPNNDAISTENIWTAENVGGVNGGAGNSVRSRWFCSLHYNQNPSGWNGFATLGDFYSAFDDDDVRKGAEYAGMTEVSGIRAGFLAGQQVDETGAALEDRNGNPLAFTADVALSETGGDLETTGIRVVKYTIDYNNGDNVDNDYVYYRYADVLMMKAEALMRNGDSAGALTIVNEIRASRGTSELSSIDADGMIAERGREFYWEGFRRTDLLRFGKFLNEWEAKGGASGSERLVFPIPSGSLASNPNLKQNDGY